MGKYYYMQFAQAYGDGAYNDCTYNDATTCGTAAGGGTSGNGSTNGTLSNTGLMLIVVITIACLIAFVAMLIRLWRRPRVARQEVPADSPPPVEDDQHQSPLV